MDDLPGTPLISRDDRAPARMIATLERKGAKRDIAVKDAGEIARIDAVIWRISVSDDEAMATSSDLVAIRSLAAPAQRVENVPWESLAWGRLA